MLLLLQVSYAFNAWSTVRPLDTSYRQQALQMGMLALNPYQLPEDCLITLLECRDPPDRRAQDMAFLVDQQLNLFSPAVQRRWGLSPGP